MQVQAAVSFQGGRAVAGRDRIRLLECIGREGSISAAARAVGLSYKAAWDALDALDTLFGCALIETRAGGQRGGGTRLTATGLRVVEALTRLEGELSRTLQGLEPGLRADGIAMANAAPGFLLRTSARNTLPGVVSGIKIDGVSATVALAVSARTTIRSRITRRSVEELGLCPGRRASALIKAPLISVARTSGEHPPGANRIRGKLIRKETGPHDTELVIDVGADEPLIATVRTARVKALGLKKHDQAWASFDPRHVILAIG